jgi:hypothetical protein
VNLIPKYTSNVVKLNDFDLCKVLIEKNQKDSINPTKSLLMDTIQGKEDIVINSKLPTNVILNTILKADLGIFVHDTHYDLIIITRPFIHTCRHFSI